jgi:hypothetical protein
VLLLYLFELMMSFNSIPTAFSLNPLFVNIKDSLGWVSHIFRQIYVFIRTYITSVYIMTQICNSYGWCHITSDDGILSRSIYIWSSSIVILDLSESLIFKRKGFWWWYLMENFHDNLMKVTRRVTNMKNLL